MNMLESDHSERNEDGILFQHSGYMLKVCRICRKEFIIANKISAKYDTCGNLACEGEADGIDNGQ